MNNLVKFWRGYHYGWAFHRTTQALGDVTSASREPAAANDLEKYFDAHTTGPGIWKWRHYFDIYDKHFAKFRGREVHILEIGIFSGGSLDMWRSYFGEKVHIYGVDIEPACRAYEAPGTRIFIGDQADKKFWQEFVREVPPLDIVIDDGGHLAAQQIPTLEVLLPHLRPGGVYLCEDLQEPFNRFLSYLNGLSRSLYTTKLVNEPTDQANLKAEPDNLQRLVDSIHLYPFIAVIERRAEELSQMSAPQHGTEWQPWLPSQEDSADADGNEIGRNGVHLRGRATRRRVSAVEPLVQLGLLSARVAKPSDRPPVRRSELRIAEQERRLSMAAGTRGCRARRSGSGRNRRTGPWRTPALGSCPALDPQVLGDLATRDQEAVLMMRKP